MVRKAIRAARSTSIPNTRATPPSSSTRRTIRYGRIASKGYEEAKKLDYDANKIVWLTPSPANNTWAIAVRKDVAEPDKLVDHVGFRQVGRGRGKVKLAGSAEFVNSAGGAARVPDGLWVHAVAGPADRALGRRYRGDDQGRGRPDQRRERRHGLRHRWRHRALGAGRMDDDKRVQPVYAPAPIMREAVLKANPKIADVLAPIFRPGPRDPAGAQCPYSARRRAGTCGGRGLSAQQRVREQLTVAATAVLTRARALAGPAGHSAGPARRLCGQLPPVAGTQGEPNRGGLTASACGARCRPHGRSASRRCCSWWRWWPSPRGARCSGWGRASWASRDRRLPSATAQAGCHPRTIPMPAYPSAPASGCCS